jgi:hypothetical protein
VRCTVFAAFCMMLLLSLPAHTQDSPQTANNPKFEEELLNLPAVIAWNPPDIAELDLFHGTGGPQHAPNPNGPYRFVEEVMGGTSPKFDVMDAKGVRWRIKLGSEANSETAASRLVWSMGYFVDENYYLEKFRVDGMRPLRRGQEFVSMVKREDGTFYGVVSKARLERKTDSVQAVGNWRWRDNPFVRSREFNGLRVMMALINNWDIRTPNNSIYILNGKRHYVVSDLGASFGKTSSLKGTKNNLKDYTESRFISETTPTHVSFVMNTRLIFPAAIIINKYLERAQRRGVVKDIPREDAQWLGGRLARLTERQLSDCFRSAGYSSDQAEAYAKVLRLRIAELNALEVTTTSVN